MEEDTCCRQQAEKGKIDRGEYWRGTPVVDNKETEREGKREFFLNIYIMEYTILKQVQDNSELLQIYCGSK